MRLSPRANPGPGRPVTAGTCSYLSAWPVAIIHKASVLM
jgi:hypothetical protein